MLLQRHGIQEGAASQELDSQLRSTFIRRESFASDFRGASGAKPPLRYVY
jgi:hypothetical protein